MSLSEGIKTAVATVTGYVRHRQFRTDYEPVPAPESYPSLVERGKAADYAAEHRARVIEEYDEFLIGHVEFDDQGLFWDRTQLETLEERLKGADFRERGALLVVFVHGWNHNAHHADGNLVSFRAVLADLAATEKAMSCAFGVEPRKIVGVYASWRGLANRFPLIRRFSFWQRKKTAHRVGQGSLLESLVWLEQIRFSLLPRKTSRLIIVGHSFGGAAVYSAVSHYIKTVAVELWNDSRLQGQSSLEKKITGFGDLVVLVNPAFEALLYDDFNRLTEEIGGYIARQHVVLMTVSAESDLATRVAFPVGQFLGRFRERKRREEKTKIHKTVGNLDPFLTHILRPADGEEEGNADLATAGVTLRPWKKPPLSATADSADREWLAFTPATKRWRIETTRDLPVRNPFLLVRSREKLIDGHNGIFRLLFVEFLRDFILAEELRISSLPEEDPSSSGAGVKTD